MNETVYILHGWAIDSENEKKWDAFRNLLKQNNLKSKFLAIPGLSTQLSEVWTLDLYVNWLDEQLPKDEKIILLGHSFGGQIACQFTAQNPERVKKLILIDSAGIIDRSVQKVVKRIVFKIAAKLGKPIFKHELFRTILYRFAREQDYLKANTVMRQTMSNVLNTEIIDYLPQIECPTAIIWGELDTVTPLKLSQMFHTLIPKSVVFVIRGARHSPQFTNQEETAKIIGSFLK